MHGARERWGPWPLRLVRLSPRGGARDTHGPTASSGVSFWGMWLSYWVQPRTPKELHRPIGRESQAWRQRGGHQAVGSGCLEGSETEDRELRRIDVGAGSRVAAPPIAPNRRNPPRRTRPAVIEARSLGQMS